MYDFLTGEAREASDINSTVEAQESCEVSSTVKAVPLDDAALEAASSNGRFLDVSRERRLTEGVGSDVFTSKDEFNEEAEECDIPVSVGSQVAMSLFQRLTRESKERRESFLYLSGVWGWTFFTRHFLGTISRYFA